MDNLRRKADEEFKTKDHDVSHPFALSKFNPAKRLFFSTGVTIHMGRKNCSKCSTI
jgi:hypothetical protein